MSERILAGSLPIQVARFGTPLALGMGLQTTFNLVDAYILGRLQPGAASAALGAIGICDQLAAIGSILCYGLSVATAVLVSRHHGEGDAAAVRRVSAQSLLLVLGLSVLFGLGAIALAGPVMRDVVGAKGRVAELGAEYLRVMVGGSFTIFLLLHLTTLQRALGSSKTPILLLLGSNVLNFFLAVLLVYGTGPAPDVFAWGPPVAAFLGLPRLELMGAAWATLLARAVVLLPTAYLVVQRFGLFRRPSWARPDPAVLLRIWHLGWPTSVQLVVRISAMLVVHSIVARAYTTETDQSATTALGIVFRLETMALFVGLGWGSAAQTFIGQNLGAGNPGRARASGVYAAAYNAALMGLLALLYGVYGDTIVAFFDPTAAVVQMAREYLRWVGPSYVGLGIGIVLGAAIQGAGATRLTLVLDAVVVCLVQLPASYLATFGLGLPPTSLWQIVAATYLIYAVVYGITYQRGSFFRATPA